MDTALSAACIVDQDMTLEYVNPAMALIFGYAPGELKGQKMDILMTPSMIKLYEEFVHAVRHPADSCVIETGGREVKGRHKDGNMLDLRVTFNTNPEQTFFVASFFDLASEKAYRKLESDMTLAMDTTFSPIAMTNTQSILTNANQAMCTTFGYAADEVVGKHIGMLMDDVARMEHDTRVEAFRRTGESNAIKVVGREIQCKHKDGQTLYLRLSLNVTEDGQLFVMSFQDMSAEIAQRKVERKHARDALLRSIYTSMPGTIAYEVFNLGPDEQIEWVAGATKLPVFSIRLHSQRRTRQLGWM